MSRLQNLESRCASPTTKLSEGLGICSMHFPETTTKSRMKLDVHLHVEVEVEVEKYQASDMATTLQSMVQKRCGEWKRQWHM